MDGLKQRIIGAVVLVSLAVIFIPMVFEQSHQKQQSHVIEIPPKPEVPKFTIEEPKAPVLRYEQTDIPADSVAEDESKIMPADEVATAEINVQQPERSADEIRSELTADATQDNTAQDKNDSAEVTASSAPVQKDSRALDAEADLSVDASGEPVAWSVQIGTFKNRDSAEKIKKELDAEGISAYTQLIQSSNGELIRVFAGPRLKKADAETLKQQMDKRYNVSSLIVRYRPAS